MYGNQKQGTSILCTHDEKASEEKHVRSFVMFLFCFCHYCKETEIKEEKGTVLEKGFQKILLFVSLDKHLCLISSAFD